jgi:nicotinamide mononucleotide transporter
LMESVLQIYYLLMAVYGWLQWRKQSTVDTQTAKILIHRWSLQQHCLALLTVAVLTAVSGYLLQHNSSAALPYVDSFTTWGAVITTYMVAKKVLENWLYWIVIDSVSVFLYIDRELYLTALLFVTYVVLVFFGYYKWRTIYQHQQPQISG